MAKGYMVEARITRLGEVGHIVTGYYAVAKDTKAEAEDTLVRFLAASNGGGDHGITAHAVREITDDEAASLDMVPGQIRQRS